VNGSTDPTTQITRNARLLLRADTIFNRKSKDAASGDNTPTYLQTHKSYYFPGFISSISHFFYETPEGENLVSREANLDAYTRDTDTEWIVKALLRDLEMPDVSRAELLNLKARFASGRCTDRKPKAWDVLVRFGCQTLLQSGN
jgi:hypothetical protein